MINLIFLLLGVGLVIFGLILRDEKRYGRNYIPWNMIDNGDRVLMKSLWLIGSLLIVSSIFVI